MMEKRTIFAIILTFLVIVLWSVIQSKYFPSTPSKPETKEVRKEETPASVEKKMEKEIVKSTAGKPLPAAKVISKKEVTVETEDYLAVFTSDGARLKHFKLKKYHYHCSGHVSGIEIKEIVERVKPKTLIPIHTLEPHLFEGLHENVKMPTLEPF